ncbi:hypothetical protein HRW08_02500 [Streptomyces lunaelactis]|nr:hypothetical protein [Streptomyces lunaelactis]
MRTTACRAAESAAGVPQGRHAHVLLEGGQLALDALLPGFVAQLKASGAPRLGQPTDMVRWQSGRWIRRTAATSYIYTGSRGQIEHLVRKRVLADRVITTLTSTEAVGLLGDASRVRGVLLQRRGEGARAAGQEPFTLEADLVVDASGRGSRASQWLSGRFCRASGATNHPRTRTGSPPSRPASRIPSSTTGYAMPNRTHRPSGSARRRVRGPVADTLRAAAHVSATHEPPRFRWTRRSPAPRTPTVGG